MEDAALNRLASLALPSAAERDAHGALYRIEPTSQTLLVLAALDAELCGLTAAQRLASVWTLAAAINLMDDIADGDCSYLPPAVAPGLVVLLQGLAWMLAMDGGVKEQGIRASSRALAFMAAGQSIEVRTHDWSEAMYRNIVDQIGGQQYAAYLHILWDGTKLSPEASEVAERIGRVGMVTKDALSHDRRFNDLAPAEKVRLEDWAREALTNLQRLNLSCGEFLARYAQPILAPPQG
jgi:hypothetical protein